jgi:phage FluMu protein Com
VSCTTEKCYRDTELYLCTECIIEFDELLKDVPALIQLLDGARAGTAIVRKPGGGGGGGVQGSRPPGSLDAMMLQAWLGQLPQRAHAAAMDNPDAGQWLYMARIWVKQARDLVWGPEDKRVYGRCETGPCIEPLAAGPDAVSVKCPTCKTVHNIAELLDKLKRKAKGEPMPPREAREFLQKEARVFILKKDFENWVQLGRLDYVLERVTTTEKARRLYYPGDVLKIYQDMRERRRISA